MAGHLESWGPVCRCFKNSREKLGKAGALLGNNPISLAGGAITSASGVTIIGYLAGGNPSGRREANPYLGIIFFLLLPAVFIAGLLLIPIGVFVRRKKLQKVGQIPGRIPQESISTTGCSATASTSC